MIFRNKTYDVLKWSVMIAIPAIATAYRQIANLFGWRYGEEVAEIAVIVCTLLGTLLGISNAAYYKQRPQDPDPDFDVEENQDEGGVG